LATTSPSHNTPFDSLELEQENNTSMYYTLHILFLPQKEKKLEEVELQQPQSWKLFKALHTNGWNVTLFL